MRLQLKVGKFKAAPNATWAISTHVMAKTALQSYLDDASTSTLRDFSAEWNDL